MRNDKMTLRQQMDAHAADQAALRVESDIRNLARSLDAAPALIDDLVLRARTIFRPAQGGLFPFAEDGITILRAKDTQNVLSVAEWTRQQLLAAGLTPPPAPAGQELPLRNPFKRKFWNITEQMRLRRQDPDRADRLKLEAWESGDLKSTH